MELGERGTIVPVTLMICLLMTGLLVFQIHVYMNAKQNIQLEEQALNLEWLIRNGERKWLDTTSTITPGVGDFSFPNGSVRYSVTVNREIANTARVRFTARDKGGNVRTHFFDVAVQEASLEENLLDSTDDTPIQVDVIKME
ncbi:competence type IV pilus minor pilin ComGG [Bacillus piscicola]|uniref:competence type IV pilus minor pilin ComGG n=1 Tax=Bacillus piscicola TaxID=1632684 RepID=UPI001F09C846|nr:competence type IV pilus minor pilin ComGG [Bacillus piscicola]